MTEEVDMCKAIQRPKLIIELAAAKKALDEAKKVYDDLQSKLISNMKSSGVKSDEVDDLRATLVIRMVPNIEELEQIPKWVELKKKEKEIADKRKEIEKDHKKEGSPFIKLTRKV